MVKVSIIIPVYNSEKTLVACLSNIVHQTLHDIEIILVNDCSTDNSLQIMMDCEAQFEDKVLIVNCDENRGAGGARNIGLSYARGEYIGFVDSDDVVSVDMYEKLYIKAVEGDYDIVDCGFFNEDTNSAIIYTSDKLVGTLDGYKRSELIASGGYFVSKIFKKSFLDKIGLKFREHCILEDCETLMLAFATARNIGNVKEILYNYKTYPTSLSRAVDLQKRFKNQTDAIDAIVDKLFDLEIYPDIQEAVEYAIVNFCVLNAKVCLAGNDLKMGPRIIKQYMDKYVKIPIRQNKYINNKIEKQELQLLQNIIKF